MWLMVMQEASSFSADRYIEKIFYTVRKGSAFTDGIIFDF